MIKVENLDFKYKTSNFSLSNINITIPNGEFVCIIGKNASGKTTFSNILSGLLRFKTGNIFIDDLDLSNKKNNLEIRKKIGVVFQNPENQLLFETVYDDMLFTLKNLNIPVLEYDSRIDKALEKVAMLKYKKTPVFELSLGQKQIVSIANSLAINPSILILDEPTTMLDSESKVRIYSILSSLKKDGITIIFITNSIDEILLSDRVLLFSGGSIEKEFYKKDLLNNLDNLKDFKSLGIISLIDKLHKKRH